MNDVVTLQTSGLAGTGQGPEASACLEHACGFQLKACNFGQIPVKLQHFLRLDHFVALADHGQGCMGVAAVEHLLLGELQGFAVQGVGITGCHIAHGCFLDLPLHASGLRPNINGLLLG